MGGLTNSQSSIIAWTGGMPKADWSRLNPGAKQKPSKSTQHRSCDSSAAALKQDILRRNGTTEKFSKGKDIDVFLRKVWQHFKYHGMDTITYLPDPIDPATIMSSVVEMHSRFSMEYAAAALATQAKLYDKYDVSNDSDATNFLMESVDDEIFKELDLVCGDDKYFPIVFLEFMKIARTVTVERINQLKAQIRRFRSDIGCIPNGIHYLSKRMPRLLADEAFEDYLLVNTRS
jgi:hypothetical protein